jgi:uncharacterized repeat protein (TIGR01451 family)
MRFKTLLLITLTLLFTSSVPWGNIDFLRIRSFPSNSNHFIQKATHNNIWKSVDPNISRSNNAVDLFNTPSIIRASEIGLQIGTFSGIIDQVPALSIAKTADPLAYTQPGQVISYTYLVTNTGDVTLYNIVVLDDKTSTTCPDTSTGLDPLGEITCTASYTTTLDDMNIGSVTNIASASADSTVSLTDTVTVTAIPMLAIDKTADPLTYDQVGQVINYTYQVSNPGYISVHGPVDVNDDKVSVNCPSINSVGNHDKYIDPGEVLTCSASYTITQADLDAGSVTNTATATADGVTSLPDTATVTVVQVPALTLVKTADPLTYDHISQVISYTYVVSNTGTLSLLGPVTVSDDKAAPVTCPPVSSVGNEDDYLDPAESLVCSATYTITQNDLDAGSVLNTATASADSTTSPEDTATVTADQLPALNLTKTADPLTYDQPGQVIDYTYIVTNTGNVTLYNITVEDDKTTSTCPDTSVGLTPLSAITCTAFYTITQDDLNAGSVINSAYATDGSVQSDPGIATVTAIQTSALDITKSADPLTYYQPGQVIAYTYQVTNTGNVTLYDIIVIDNKTTATCPDTSEGLDPLSEITCTASYTITQDDLNAGSVTNSAYATDGSVQSDPSTATVTVVPVPALTLVKTADPLTYDHVSQVISYTYVVSNTGNLSLHGPVIVSDDKATDEYCPPVNSVGNTDDYLDPGEVLTCTASYTITQDDLDAGSVTNNASASVDGAVSDDKATVYAIQSPALTITKTADPLIYNQPGQVITYTYLVSNTGNVSIYSPFEILDDKTDNESCPPSPTSLNPGQSITCTSSYIIQGEDMTRGYVTNEAYATGMFNDNPILSNTDTETITTVNIVRYTFLPTVYMSKPGVQILPNYFTYTSANNTIQYIIGEVVNNTNSTLTWVNIEVNFYNSSHVFLGSSQSYMWPLNLPPWERGCFTVSSAILLKDGNYLGFETPSYNYGVYSPGLALLDSSGSYTPLNGFYNISGHVQNNGTQVINDVAVGGTLYNSSGAPVGCDYNLVAGINLNPGQTDSFTINFDDRDYYDVTNYKLRVSTSPH